MQLNTAAPSRNTIQSLDIKTLLLLSNDIANEISKKKTQYLEGGVLKLPHWDNPRYLSQTQSTALKMIGGTSTEPPPVVTWAMVNKRLCCGYRSFDELFYNSDNRSDILEQVSYGKYRLRRL